MLAILIKVTVLLAAIASAAYGLRRRSAAVRHLLWTLGIVGLIVLPALALLAPFRLPILPARAPLSEATPVASARHEHVAATDAEPADAPTIPTAAAIVDTPTRSQWPMDARRTLFVAWIAVAGVLLLRFLVGVLMVHRIARRAAPLEEDGWRALTDRARRALNVTPTIELRRSDDVAMPFAYGVMKPVIVLPAAASEWSMERRTAVLMHEVAHISRGDLAMNIVSHVARAVYWFHPLAWLAAYRLRVEGERSCDDAVLRSGALPSEYADHLLSIVQTAGPTVPGAALAMARRSDFEGRLLAILEPGVPRGRVTRMRAAAVTALFLAVVMPLAAMTPSVAAAVRQTDSSASRGAQGEPSSASVAALIATLNDSSTAVRLAAVGSLGSLGDPKAIAALAKALREDTDARVREAAAHALGEIDDRRAVPALVDALKAERVANVRVEIVKALGEIDDPSAAPGIIAVLKDANVGVRRAAVEALGELKDEAAVAPIIDMARDDDVEVRRHVAEALGHLENPSAINALIGLTRDADADTRKQAVEALAQFEDERALPTFLTALKDADADVRQQAADAIGNLHDKIKAAPRALIDALGDRSRDVRHNAAHALGHIGDVAAVPALTKLTSDSDTEVRQAAAQSLSEIGGPEAIQALMVLLKDPDPEIRKIAAEALGKKRR